MNMTSERCKLAKSMFGNAVDTYYYYYYYCYYYSMELSPS
jgi:hypothetical protein